MGTPASRYDEFADWYHAWVAHPDEDFVASSLFDAAPDVRGHYVLDLACGQGRIARSLTQRGASVVAVDLSSALLAIARDFERKAPTDVTYLEGDVCSTAWWDGQPFDGVISSMTLMDIDDLDSALSTVKTVTKPGAWFAFSVIHPCFSGLGNALQSWPSGATYFDEGWWNTGGDGVRGRVGCNHRTLSTYLNGLIDRGFVLERSIEPPGKPGDAPMPTPFFLIMRWRRAHDD